MSPGERATLLRGESIKRFARRSGLSRITVSRFLAGARVSPRTFDRLAKALGIPKHDLGQMIEIRGKGNYGPVGRPPRDRKEHADAA